MTDTSDQYRPPRISRWSVLAAWIVFFVPSMALTLHWYPGTWGIVFPILFGVGVATSMTLGALYAVFLKTVRDRA